MKSASSCNAGPVSNSGADKVMKCFLEYRHYGPAAKKLIEWGIFHEANKQFADAGRLATAFLFY